MMKHQNVTVITSFYKDYPVLFECVTALKTNISIFNFFHYVTVRAVAALLTALTTSIIGGAWYIRFAHYYFRAQSRQYTPESHRVKDNLPTMGGIFIVGNVLLSILFWCNLRDPRVWISIATMLMFGAIGLWDDWTKIVTKRGISERTKFSMQCISAACIILLWWYFCTPQPLILIPLVKQWSIVLPRMLFICWAIFVLVGTSNAVNITDGLDGLAMGSLIQNFITFALIAYCAGHTVFARYLHIPYVGTTELAIVGGALIGASLGFLWFNAYPAQIFMGDVGSLSLGAMLGMIALMTRQEFLLAISGALFVVEAISVMLQVAYFRHSKKRLFRMAPIHHHFELLGWPEAKIVARFSIITSVACLCALMMLKAR